MQLTMENTQHIQTHTPHTPTIKPGESQRFINALVEANGNPNVALEALNRNAQTTNPDAPKLTYADFVRTVVHDPDAFQVMVKSLRVMQMLMLFTMNGLAQLTLQAKLADLKPGEASRLYTQLMTITDTLTSPKTAATNNTTNTTNTFELVMQALPQEQREALATIVKVRNQLQLQGTQPTTLDHVANMNDGQD